MVEAESARWSEKKYDLLIDLIYEMAQNVRYKHIDKAMLRDNMYIPKGYGDAEDELRQIRQSWLQVLNSQRPIQMTMVGPVQVEPPLQPLEEITRPQTSGAQVTTTDTTPSHSDDKAHSAPSDARR